jgi:hypothetical protein
VAVKNTFAKTNVFYDVISRLSAEQTDNSTLKNSSSRCPTATATTSRNLEAEKAGREPGFL